MLRRSGHFTNMIFFIGICELFAQSLCLLSRKLSLSKNSFVRRWKLIQVGYLINSWICQRMFSFLPRIAKIFVKSALPKHEVFIISGVYIIPLFTLSTRFNFPPSTNTPPPKKKEKKITIIINKKNATPYSDFPFPTPFGTFVALPKSIKIMVAAIHRVRRSISTKGIMDNLRFNCFLFLDT